MKSTPTRILFVVIVLAMFAANSSAQTRTPISGEWRIEFTRDEPDQVQLTMFHGNGGRKQNWGHGVKLSELQGLPVEQARNSAIDGRCFISHLRLGIPGTSQRARRQPDRSTGAEADEVEVMPRNNPNGKPN